MSFFWATCALILSTSVDTSSRSCFSARSMQPTAERAASAGIAHFRVFITVASTIRTQGIGRFLRGSGIISVLPRRITNQESRTKNRGCRTDPPVALSWGHSGFLPPHEPDLAVAPDHGPDDGRLLAGLPERLEDGLRRRWGEDDHQA